MIGPRQDAYDVRHDEPDEPDDAGDGDGRADAGRGREHDQALCLLHLDAEMECLRLAEQESVQCAHEPRREVQR